MNSHSARTGSVVALVPAAGKGLRLGRHEPKAFVVLGEHSLLARSVDGLRKSGVVDRIVVIVPADLVDAAREQVGPEVTIVVGGAERTDSVRVGLNEIGDADVVLVHDAARALTPPSLIARVVAEVRAGRSAVIPVLPVVDTIKAVDLMGAVVGTPDRSGLRSVQTPQGFEASVLRRAYEASDTITTDDAGLVEGLGETVHTIVGEAMAFKITTPHDMLLAEALIREVSV